MILTVIIGKASSSFAALTYFPLSLPKVLFLENSNNAKMTGIKVSQARGH